jgi:hypothetical protein
LSANHIDAAHGYGIKYANFFGEMSVDQYGADWQAYPPLTEPPNGGPNPVSWGGGFFRGQGGCEIGVHWTGVGVGSTSHWVQVVSTNNPQAQFDGQGNRLPYVYGPTPFGEYWFVDNGGTIERAPFLDAIQGATANQANFIDGPHEFATTFPIRTNFYLMRGTWIDDKGNPVDVTSGRAKGLQLSTEALNYGYTIGALPPYAPRPGGSGPGGSGPTGNPGAAPGQGPQIFVGSWWGPDVLYEPFGNPTNPNPETHKIVGDITDSDWTVSLKPLQAVLSDSSAPDASSDINTALQGFNPLWRGWKINPGFRGTYAPAVLAVDSTVDLTGRARAMGAVMAMFYWPSIDPGDIASGLSAKDEGVLQICETNDELWANSVSSRVVRKSNPDPSNPDGTFIFVDNDPGKINVNNPIMTPTGLRSPVNSIDNITNSTYRDILDLLRIDGQKVPVGRGVFTSDHPLVDLETFVRTAWGNKPPPKQDHFYYRFTTYVAKFGSAFGGGTTPISIARYGLTWGFRITYITPPKEKDEQVVDDKQQAAQGEIKLQAPAGDSTNITNLNTGASISATLSAPDLVPTKDVVPYIEAIMQKLGFKYKIYQITGTYNFTTYKPRAGVGDWAKVSGGPVIWDPVNVDGRFFAPDRFGEQDAYTFTNDATTWKVGIGSAIDFDAIAEGPFAMQLITTDNEILIQEISPIYTSVQDTSTGKTMFVAVRFNSNRPNNIGGQSMVGAVSGQTYTVADVINPRVPISTPPGGIPSLRDWQTFGPTVFTVYDTIQWVDWAGARGGSLDPNLRMGQSMVRRYCTLQSKGSKIPSIQIYTPVGVGPRKSGVKSSVFVPPVPAPPAPPPPLPLFPPRRVSTFVPQPAQPPANLPTFNQLGVTPFRYQYTGKPVNY